MHRDLRPLARALVAGSASAALLLGCDSNQPLDPARAPTGVSRATKGQGATATLTILPSLGGPSEALAVDAAGAVIAGYGWDRSDVIHAVKWTLQNGAWAISALPQAATATGAIARGVDDQGDAAGNDFPGATSHAVLWPAAGGFAVLGCGEPEAATVYGISAGGQVEVGSAASAAAVWRPAGCREDLPSLGAGGFSRADAANGDGTIVGGAAAPTNPGDGVPVRWQGGQGQWQIVQLDNRPGSVHGANAVGDLAGQVLVPCAAAGGCQRAVIWYAAGGSLVLGTLGGADSWARDINSAGEVVGGSTAPRIGNTAYFWSSSLGMFQLPFKGRWAAANAVSDVRPDGTRLVVGMDSQGQPIAWIVRTP
jgi:uncharacterized membrane protein